MKIKYSFKYFIVTAFALVVIGLTASRAAQPPTLGGRTLTNQQ